MLTKTRALKPLMAMLLFAMLQSANASDANNANSNDLTFGIVPQQSATTLAQNWVPIMKYLGQQTGLKIRFQTAKDIPAFESRVSSGAYDLVYMNPFHYVTYSQSAGYRAFAHQSNKKIKGILVKKKQSPVNSLEDLAGETLAFPSPAAFAASLLPRAKLNELGVSYQARFVGSHDSVYRAVARGIYPAGGGIMRTYNSVSPEVRDQLEILWTSEGFTPHAFAAHKRVPVEKVKDIARVLLLMQQSEEGRNLLSRIKFKGIQRAEHSDWDDVSALKINPEQSGVVIK